jgi:hypothetical protein
MTTMGHQDKVNALRLAPCAGAAVAVVPAYVNDNQQQLSLTVSS